MMPDELDSRKQAETIVKTHVDYKYKNCKIELVRMESEVERDDKT